MKFLQCLRNFLYEKEISNIDPNSADRLALHKLALDRKPILKNVFIEFHHEIMRLDKKYSDTAKGDSIELGAGVYPIKNSYPQVLATDIVPSIHLDKMLDAQNMDVASNSIRAIYGQNCFHHFPDPSAFFHELERVLVSGGSAILIEPYYGPLASIMYKHLFTSESFDKKGGWNTPTNGPMQNANQALSYIVFKRDKEIFERNFKQLQISYSAPLTNYPRYFLSGGLNFRSLMPNFMEYPMKLLEKLLAPLARIFALHQIIVISHK